MTKQKEPIKFSGKAFKSVNLKGEKARVWITKGIDDNNVFYSIGIRKVIKKENFKFAKNFRILRESENYLLIENEILLIEKSFANIIDIALNHLTE